MIKEGKDNFLTIKLNWRNKKFLTMRFHIELKRDSLLRVYKLITISVKAQGTQPRAFLITFLFRYRPD